jgi:hypothetical protein
MKLRLRKAVSLLVVVLVVVSGLSSLAAADEDYQLSPSTSIDTPDQTITVDGTDYTVSHVGRAMHGDAIEFDVAAPDDTSYQVYLYNGDRDIVDTESLTGDGTATFETGSLEAGTYVAAVYGPDGQFRDVVPVVVAGYSVDVSAPGTVTEGSEFSVSVTLDSVTQVEDPNTVEVVVTNDGGVQKRVDAVRQSDGQYTADVAADFAAGEHDLYVNVRGDDTARDRNELIAISDAQSLQVEAAADETPTDGADGTDGTDGSSGGGDGGDAGGNSGDGDSAAAGTATGTQTVTETVAATETTEAAGETPTQTPTQTPTSTSTSDVVTPAETTSQTTATETPSYALHVVAGLLILFGAGRRLRG